MEDETGYGYLFSIFSNSSETEYLVRVVYFSPKGTYDEEEKFFGPAKSLEDAESLRDNLKKMFENLVREQMELGIQ